MADQSSAGTVAIATGSILGLLGIGLGIYTANTLTPPAVETQIETPKKEVAVVAKARAASEQWNKKRRLMPIPMDRDGTKYRDNYLFFAPELWEAASAEKKANILVDIYDKNSATIHPNIPNTWFVDHGLKDIMGRADAPAIDSDKDGFDNREEFMNGTNPTDAKSYPSLVAPGAVKVFVTKIRKNDIQIAAPSMLALEKDPKIVRFSLYQGFAASPSVKKDVPVGGKFGFPDAPDRFVLEGFEQRPFSGMGGTLEQETVARVKDTAAIGTPTYYIRAGRSKQNDKLLNTDQEKGRRVVDTFVDFIVTAGSAANTPAGSFTVVLKDTFTIPGNGKTTFTLESVNDDGGVIIKETGKDLPITITRQ